MKLKQDLYSLCLILSVLCIVSNSYTQTDSTHHIIYHEFGGPGGIGSVNYEYKILQKNKLEINPRIGFGTAKLIDYKNEFNPDINVVINAQISYGTRHRISLGAGYILSNSVHAISISDTKRLTTSNSNVQLGYQFQSNSKGIFARTAYVLLIERSFYLRHWGGLSIGVIL